MRTLLSIPLGGERGSKWRVLSSIFVTMTLCGLWHGAAWTFVFFGMLHGLLQMGHRLFEELCAGRPHVQVVLKSPPGTLARMAVTFLTFAVSLIVFRADSLGTALGMMQGLFVSPGVRVIPQHEGIFWSIVLLVAVCHLVAGQNLWKKLADRLPASAVGFGYAAVLAVALVVAPELDQAFIYFQF